MTLDSVARQFVHDAPQHAVFAAALALFVSAIAYLHNPRLKALIYSMPVPFTCAYLATRLPLNATHLTGLVLIVGYNWLIYFAHARWRMPLGAAIALGVFMYVAGAVLLRPLTQTSPLWVAGPIAAAWLAVVLRYHPRDEPGHRSAMAWWLKMPLVFAIGMVLFSSTALLAGAVSTFPYAGTFTSFEMRRSLRTLAGQFTINAMGLLMAMLVIGALETRWPRLLALLAGWTVHLAWVAMTYRTGWGRPKAEEAFIED